MQKRALLVLMGALAASSWTFAQPPGGGKGKPPQEAITACEGQSEGDSVSFTLDNGDTIEATCREHRDQLIAVPNKRPPRDHARSSDD